MSVISPEGQRRAVTFEINSKYRRRDQNVGLRGETQHHQDDVSRDDRLGAELDREADGHSPAPILEEPHVSGLLPPAHEDDAHEWEEQRRIEEATSEPRGG